MKVKLEIESNKNNEYSVETNIYTITKDGTYLVDGVFVCLEKGEQIKCKTWALDEKEVIIE